MENKLRDGLYIKLREETTEDFCKNSGLSKNMAYKVLHVLPAAGGFGLAEFLLFNDSKEFRYYNSQNFTA